MNYFVLFGGLGNDLTYFEKLITCLRQKGHGVHFVSLHDPADINPDTITCVLSDLLETPCVNRIILCFFSASCYLACDIVSRCKQLKHIRIAYIDPPHRLWLTRTNRCFINLMDRFPRFFMNGLYLMNCLPGLRQCICRLLHWTIDKDCPEVVNNCLLQQSYTSVRSIVGSCVSAIPFPFSDRPVALVTCSTSPYYKYHCNLRDYTDKAYTLRTLHSKHGHHFIYFDPEASAQLFETL